MLLAAVHALRLQGPAQELAAVRLPLDQRDGTADPGHQTHQIQVPASDSCCRYLTFTVNMCFCVSGVLVPRKLTRCLFLVFLSMEKKGK